MSLELQALRRVAEAAQVFYAASVQPAAVDAFRRSRRALGLNLRALDALPAPLTYAELAAYADAAADESRDDRACTVLRQQAAALRAATPPAEAAPQPQGETMEVHLYRYVKKPWLRSYLPGNDGPPPDPPYYLVAKWTGPVPPLPPAVPVITATVEPV